MIITAFLIPGEAELSQLLHTYIEKRAPSIMGRQYGLLAWILLERLYLRVAAAADAAHSRRESETSSHFLAAICNKKSAIHKFDRVSWHLADINGFSFNMMAHSFTAAAAAATTTTFCFSFIHFSIFFSLLEMSIF
jgi:hypothetical protein